jgi:hypothetical protein
MNGKAIVGIVLLAGLVASAAAEERISATEGMELIVRYSKEKDADLLELTMPEKLVEGREGFDEPENVTAWREGLAREIAAAKKVTVAESGDRGVARFEAKPRGTEKLLILAWNGRRWILDCAQSYLVKGKLLKRARGRGPAHVELTARQNNQGWTGNAWSFAYATGTPDQCKNRMSIWYCKYGDLHAVGDCRIATAGRKKLDDVEAIDPAWEFGRHVEPHAGEVYAVHCLDAGRGIDCRGIDFYAKLAVTSVDKGAINLDWEILAAGPGSPTTIHEPNPVADPRSGADGCDGMCGGKMR